jgi:ABC-type Fe3+/spermidine/putrescine transport system ATPase subunit
VFVTHDQAEAMTMSDRIAVLAGGRLQQVGTPAALYETPANAFVAGFVGESNLLEVRVVAAGSDEVVVRTAGGIALRLAPVPAAAPPRVTERAWVLLRPEALAVGPAPGEGEGGVAGVVEEVRYLGAAWRYRIRLNEREHVVAIRSRHGQVTGPGPGAKITITWPAGEARLLWD